MNAYDAVYQKQVDETQREIMLHQYGAIMDPSEYQDHFQKQENELQKEITQNTQNKNTAPHDRITALVLKHEQQIKDIAAHLLELKQLITPMMEFKQEKSKNEPVAWLVTYGGLTHVEYTQPTQVVDTHYQPLYIALHRPWVGLTDDEIWTLHDSYPNPVEFARDIEAKLLEKNGG